VGGTPASENSKLSLRPPKQDERAVLQLFVGWIAGERGLHAEALKTYAAVRQLPHLKAWGLLGQAL